MLMDKNGGQKSIAEPNKLTGYGPLPIGLKMFLNVSMEHACFGLMGLVTSAHSMICPQIDHFF